jgi:DNA topoisomerase-1
MEEKLDSIEEQGANWRNIVSDFYGPLSKELEYADQKIEKVKLEDTLTGEMCEKCGKPLAIKHGRFGDFIACTGFPDCRFTKKIQKTVGVKCPVCGKDILEKKGKKGRVFYGCSGYPDCQKAYWYKPTDKKCPKCGELLVEHKVKGKTLECPNENCDYTE